MLAHEIHGEGPNVVLLHGFPLDRRIWKQVTPGLEKSMRVITLDLRGFGQSHSTEAFTISSLADDVKDTLDQLGVLPAVIGGLSMGGYVTLAFAKQYPADLTGLLLIDTRAEADTPDGKLDRNRMIELVRAKGPPAIADRMMPKLLWPPNVAEMPDVVDHLRGIMENCSAGTIEHALIAMCDREDYMDFLPSIEVPARVIVGESDVITPPAMAQAMSGAIPQCDCIAIRGAGHMTPMERPEEVIALISEFVSSLA